MKKWRKKVLLIKPETTYGTDATPTGAANAIQVSDFTVTPLVAQEERRGLVSATLGSEGTLPTGVHHMVEFAVEIAGSGAVDTAPAWGVLLRGCAMAETITPTTGPVEYDPVSEGEESVSIYANLDGTLHKLLGARGNVRLDIASPGVPRFRFQFTGLWADPAAVALPTPDYSAFQTPKTVSNANTPTFTLGGTDLVLRRLEIDLGNRIVHRDLVNSESVVRADRQASGRLVIESPGLGTFDAFAAAKNATLNALQLVHGTAAGAIVQIDAPKVQLKNPRYSEEEGIEMLEVDLELVRDAGDDELKITAK